MHVPNEHLWIDSICINQSDLEEEAEQVRIMGNVYRQSSRVLACIGPHANGSELLVRKARQMERWKLLATRMEGLDVEQGSEELDEYLSATYWEPWLVALPSQEIAELRYALCA